MKLFISIIAAAGVLAEAVAVYGFWLGYESTIIFIAMHLVANFFVIIALSFFLKSFYQKLPVTYVLLLTSFSVFLPLLGVLLSCILTFLAYRFSEARNEHLIRIVKRQYEAEPLDIRYGVGGVRVRLQSKKFPLSSKTAALFAMGNSKLNTTNNILQEILPDKEEDLRLLAFGLLEFQEKDINNHICATAEYLEKTTDPIQKAFLQKQIAQLYWELVYRGLSSDMEKLILEHARNYAEEALKKLEDYASLWVLLGKIHYRLKNVELAHEMFMRAKNLGAPLKDFVSYLAENAYRQRNFDEVIEFFKNSGALRDIPTIGPVVRFWNDVYDHKN